MNTFLCDLAARALRQMLGERRISATELLESCITRISAVNVRVNAVVTTCFDAARQEAAQADAMLRAGSTVPLLHGLPVLVKDLSDTRGLRTTYGSPSFEHYVPETDALVVQRLRRAGAIVIGKTNTPEFGAGANTVNPVFGATLNPFNTELTCGGSSGGSAVALACGMAPLATGSDLGGSLRIPASFCSVVGMRPSPGLVPSTSHVLGFSPLWTDGPMARNVGDTALLLSALAGFDVRDPLSAPGGFDSGPGFDLPVDLGALRIGFSATLGMGGIARAIAAAFAERMAMLGRLVPQTRELALDLSEAASIFRVLRIETLYASHAELVARNGDRVGPNIRANIRAAAALSLADAAQAGAAHTRLYRRFQAMFDEFDVLLVPATAVTPFPVTQNHATHIDDRALDDYADWYAITWALSLTASPIVTLPCGRDQTGMPMGLQVVARRGHDAKALQVARALEEVFAAAGVSRVVPDLADK